MKNFSTNEQEQLKKLGFYWSDISQEFFSDAWDDEMGIHRDSADFHLILRTRSWDDEDCEYQDHYEHFSNFDELMAFLS